MISKHFQFKLAIAIAVRLYNYFIRVPFDVFSLCWTTLFEKEHWSGEIHLNADLLSILQFSLHSEKLSCEINEINDQAPVESGSVEPVDSVAGEQFTDDSDVEDEDEGDEQELESESENVEVRIPQF